MYVVLVKRLNEILFAALTSVHLSMVIGRTEPMSGCEQFLAVAAVGTSKGGRVAVFAPISRGWQDCSKG